MATIVKRGDNWRAQIRMAGRKPLSASFSKKVLAERWVREREAELEQGKFVKEDPDFGVLIQRYIDEILPLKPMQRSHVATMRGLKRQVNGNKVSEIDANWMLEFAKGHTVAPSTLAQKFIFLGLVLRTADTFWGVRPNWDEWNRGRKGMTSMGLIGSSIERDRRVSDDEIEQVLDCMQSSLPMDDLIAFAVGSAMRLSEVVRIQWADLNQANRTVVIRDRKHPRKKRGNHQTVPLLGETFEIVKRQMKWKPEIFPYDPNSISAAWHRATIRAGFEDLRWHDLRHEGISRLFENGYGVEQVAIVSGHTDWRMLKRYTHLKPESLHRDVA
jgi:integrase